MSTKKIAPRLAGRLCTLAESQLQMQTSRSAALNTGALGVMAIDAALAAIVIDTGGDHALWIAALALLAMSLALAARTLRLAGAKRTGPSVARIHEACATEDHRRLEESLLNDLTEDIFINEQALARKASLFDRAQTLLLLAIVIELAGRLQ
ncbi:MAG: hypothetical protein ACRDK7_04575 [Solirubrobacteraceae bacterium]